jgi:hypothetical protein
MRKQPNQNTYRKVSGMSRGMGKVQRIALAILEASEEPIETFTIAADVYAVPKSDRRLVTPAQVVATLRALRSLERSGKIAKTGRRYRVNREHWASKKVADALSDRWRAFASNREIARRCAVSPNFVEARRRDLEAGTGAPRPKTPR